MKDPYARHGRDKFLKLLIDFFSKLNRRDFDRPFLISAVLFGNFRFRQLREILSGATLDVLMREIGTQIREPRKSPVDPHLQRYSYAVDATYDLSSRWSSLRLAIVQSTLWVYYSRCNLWSKYFEQNCSVYFPLCYIWNFFDCLIKAWKKKAFTIVSVYSTDWLKIIPPKNKITFKSI